MSFSIEIATSVTGIPAATWNGLAGENPVVRHAYFLALEESGAASVHTGWQPHFLLAFDAGILVGILPLYAKSHSYGEFVFDQPWADAYERQGLRYYPKLVCSVPFTPVTGPRMLAGSAEVRALLVGAAIEVARRAGASSFHCLFPEETQKAELAEMGLSLRQTVQFHWRNAGWRDFAGFVASLRHDKRKNILRERRKLREAGVTYERILGTHATAADWAFFYRCYLQTHALYRSPVPLTLDFFLRLGRTMPESILLVFASRGGQRIAAAFDLFSSTHLYGRSWGTLEYLPGLHFELCYYQGIEFCLERGLAIFEGGAQGEHKLARGLLPVATSSAHWLAHAEFANAVEDFLAQESSEIGRYVNELEDSSPFKQS